MARSSSFFVSLLELRGDISSVFLHPLIMQDGDKNATQRVFLGKGESFLLLPFRFGTTAICLPFTFSCPPSSLHLTHSNKCNHKLESLQEREGEKKPHILICHYRLGSVSSAAIFLAAFHFRLQSELSEQVIGGFEPKTDQICQ